MPNIEPVSTGRPNLIGHVCEASREGPRQRRADDRNVKWGSIEVAGGRVFGFDELNEVLEVVHP